MYFAAALLPIARSVALAGLALPQASPASSVYLMSQRHAGLRLLSPGLEVREAGLVHDFLGQPVAFPPASHHCPHSPQSFRPERRW
jgi:hypothetical protein